MQLLQFLCSNVKSYEIKKPFRFLNGFLISETVLFFRKQYYPDKVISQTVLNGGF